MDSLKEYNISFVKLKHGKHEYFYNIEDAFFSLKEQSLIQQGKVNVHLLLDKKERLMNLAFTFEGYIVTDCDVCLDSFKMPIKGEDTLLVKIVDTPQPDDDEIMYLGPHDDSFNIYDYIYEMLCISIPMSKKCSDNLGSPKSCNPEMLKFLSDSLNEANNETEIDPRWDKLKNIKD